MADVLSQSEVESLLAALDSGPGGGGGPASPMGAAPAPRRHDEYGSDVSVYDFKRPERVSKDQMRAFQALHEGFSRELGAAISGMLRTIVEVKLISVDQLTYSEFVFSLENPTCYILMHSESLDGHFILDLNPSIIFPIVDRMLGGGSDQNPNVPRRPLTDIEIRIVSRITDLVIAGLQKAWHNIADLSLVVTQTESNPQLVQIVPPNEVVVLISFELTLGEMRGIMNLCIPFNSVEPVATKLAANSWSSYTKKTPDLLQTLNLESGVSRAKVELTVHLAESTLKLGELASLSVGDIIMTETEKTQPFKVLIEGAPKYEAFPGQYRGYKAIRIGKMIDRPSKLVEEEIQRREKENDRPAA